MQKAVTTWSVSLRCGAFLHLPDTVGRIAEQPEQPAGQVGGGVLRDRLHLWAAPVRAYSCSRDYPWGLQL